MRERDTHTDTYTYKGEIDTHIPERKRHTNTVRDTNTHTVRETDRE